MIEMDTEKLDRINELELKLKELKDRMIKEEERIKIRAEKRLEEEKYSQQMDIKIQKLLKSIDIKCQAVATMKLSEVPGQYIKEISTAQFF